MPEIVFGTAQLYELADEAQSRRLLEEAWRVGFRRFDTAPSYGGGRSEPELGAFLAGRGQTEMVSTKVGLTPRIGSRPGLRTFVPVLKAALPEPVTRRLRRSAHARAAGRFSPEQVSTSVAESLRRLGGHVDRLLLHEVQPAEVTDELLGTLQHLLDNGDVGAVGVATQNELTAETLTAGSGLFTVVHLAVGPLAAPVELPDSVTTRVGHGLLGGAGDTVRRLQAALAAGPAVAEQWRAATAGTEFASDMGLVQVLLSRGPHLAVTDLLVATTRPAHVADGLVLGGRVEPLPAPVMAALDVLVESARSRPR